MWHRMHQAPRLRPRLRLLPAIVVLCSALLLLVTACDASPTGGVPTATSLPSATATTPANPTATGTPPSYPVKVYFSRHPDSDNNPNAVFAVQRVSPTLGVATYAIQQLIAGPTATERTAGYYTELTGALSGSSNCGGADFTIALDHRGPKPETGTATLQFCRTTALPGDLSGGRITAQITKTLTQFPNNQRVVILTSGGACFDDLSGRNACLS